MFSKSTDNVDIKIKFVPIVTEIDGNRYLKISSTKFKLAFDTSRLYLNLENLFNGNKALGDSMNQFLNGYYQTFCSQLSFR